MKTTIRLFGIILLSSMFLNFGFAQIPKCLNGETYNFNLGRCSIINATQTNTPSTTSAGLGINATTNTNQSLEALHNCKQGEIWNDKSKQCESSFSQLTVAVKACEDNGGTYSLLTNTCTPAPNMLGTVTVTGKKYCYTDCYSGCNQTYTDLTSAQNISCKAVCKQCAEQADKTVMGITIGPKCLKNGQCGFNIYQLLGINKSTSPTLFVQDILLSASFFIGTIITLALIYSGFLYVKAGMDGKDPSEAKTGITYSIIGLVLVITSYSLIRLIQYIAKGF